jgi:sulfonate transport system substrate-binding protein
MFIYGNRRKALAGIFASLVLSTLSQSVAAQNVPKEVRIGWQKGVPILVLAKKQQAIENRLKSIGIESVKWVEFQFGPPMMEALGAGAIDLGPVGDTPPIFAQAGGADLVYAASTPSAEHAVLVPKDSPIKSVSELKGKRIAVAKGSSAHNVTIKALALSQLTPKDVELVFLPPADATAAFNGGKVDAWVVWDPFYAVAELRYGARAIASTVDKRLDSAGYYMANRAFANRYPKVLGLILDEIKNVSAKADKNRDELAQLAAEVSGLDVPTWAKTFGRADIGLTPISEANIAQQQQLGDTFFSLGIIPKKINVRDIVWHAPSGGN